jgi:hypothetical protein
LVDRLVATVAFASGFHVGSARTLLIATTLVALMLGLIVYALNTN